MNEQAIENNIHKFSEKELLCSIVVKLRRMEIKQAEFEASMLRRLRNGCVKNHE